MPAALLRHGIKNDALRVSASVARSAAQDGEDDAGEFVGSRHSDKLERLALHQESLRGLAKRYGINPKTVAKWKARETVGDRPAGPRDRTKLRIVIEGDHEVM